MSDIFVYVSNKVVFHVFRNVESELTSYKFFKHNTVLKDKRLTVLGALFFSQCLHSWVTTLCCPQLEIDVFTIYNGYHMTPA